MVDESTATKDPNIKRFNFHPIIPYKVKRNNLALPMLSNRVKTNNIKKYERLFMSNILNQKKNNPKNSEFFKFYHPWLNNIRKVKNEEKKSSAYYYYDITKITNSTINISKIRLNDPKNSFNLFKKIENDNYTINNVSKKRFSDVSTNTNIGENNDEKRNLSNENNINKKLRYKFTNPFLEKIINNKIGNSFLALRKKELKKNSTSENIDPFYKIVESSKIKNNRRSFLNKKISFHYNKSNDDILKSNLNYKNSIFRDEFKTKKIKNNSKYFKRKILGDILKLNNNTKFI